jgi:hypothetical protein
MPPSLHAPPLLTRPPNDPTQELEPRSLQAKVSPHILLPSSQSTQQPCMPITPISPPRLSPPPLPKFQIPRNRIPSRVLCLLTFVSFVVRLTAATRGKEEGGTGGAKAVPTEAGRDHATDTGDEGRGAAAAAAAVAAGHDLMHVFNFLPLVLDDILSGCYVACHSIRFNSTMQPHQCGHHHQIVPWFKCVRDAKDKVF